MYKKIEKDSVEISLKSINESDLTKNNTREEKAIATNTTEINKDICDTQNNCCRLYKNWCKESLW